MVIQFASLDQPNWTHTSFIQSFLKGIIIISYLKGSHIHVALCIKQSDTLYTYINGHCIINTGNSRCWADTIEKGILWGRVWINLRKHLHGFLYCISNRCISMKLKRCSLAFIFNLTMRIPYHLVKIHLVHINSPSPICLPRLSFAEDQINLDSADACTIPLTTRPMSRPRAPLLNACCPKLRLLVIRLGLCSIPIRR